jgi:SnoaL-like polyketide cyclase
MHGEGKAACVEFFGSWYSAFSDAHVEVHKAHFIDDSVVEEGTFIRTHDGVLPTPSGDVPPTGRAVSVPYIHPLRYHDGLHVSFNLLFDRLLMLEQLGLVPAPAATQ